MSFSQVLAQERAKAFLKGAIAAGRVSHAYLFAGPAGTGRGTTALAFCRVLNCLRPEGGDACGTCASCRRMADAEALKNYPDLVEVVPDGQYVKIDRIRELNRVLAFAPVYGRYRVCLIRKAEALRDEAANAFLKTLEEPPPGNVFILSATEPMNLLPTILSRCQRVSFQPLPREVMVPWLTSFGGVTREKAEILSRMSRGSLGWALRVSKGDFLKKRNRWLTAIRGFGALPWDAVMEMAFTYPEGERSATLEATEGEKAGMLDMFWVWQTWFRDLLLLTAGMDADRLYNGDHLDMLLQEAGSLSPEAAVLCLFTLDRACRELRTLRNGILVLEYTLMELKRALE